MCWLKTPAYGKRDACRLEENSRTLIQYETKIAKNNTDGWPLFLERRLVGFLPFRRYYMLFFFLLRAGAAQLKSF